MALKNIVILSPAHPLRGGIAASSERLAREMQSKGYAVKIISFRLQYPGFLFPGKTQYTDDPPPPRIIIETALNSINPLNWIRLGRRLKREKPDLIIARYWMPFMGPCLGTVMRIAAGNRHTRCIALADNIIPHESRPGDHRLTRYFVGAIDGFIVMSRSVADDVRQFSTAKPVTYIPHPVYDNYGRSASREESLDFLQLPAGTRYLLFFGFIRDYKGLDLLLQAMGREEVRALDVKLIVAGEYYGGRERYEQIIRESDIAQSVILKTDFIPNDEVKYYFGAADLVVQPYKSATQSGISQLAYHFEKPMLVTNVGGLPEIVEHGKAGYVVDVNVEAIAASIVDFYKNNRLDEMTRGVRENKKLFSWARMVEGIEEMYNQLSIDE